MHLFDLPHELLSYIVRFVDPDILRTLYLIEKHVLHHIFHHFLLRNITVIFGTDSNTKLNAFSFVSGRLAAIRSLSIVVDGYLDVSHSSFSSVLASMVTINHIHVNGGAGPCTRFILENTMACLVILQLVSYDAERQCGFGALLCT